MVYAPNDIIDAIAKALIKAWEDEKVHQELIKHPIQTIERLTGVLLTIKSTANTCILKNKITSSNELELPSYLEINGSELYEEKLDLIIGGADTENTSMEDFRNFLKQYL